MQGQKSRASQIEVLPESLLVEVAGADVAVVCGGIADSSAISY